MSNRVCLVGGPKNFGCACSPVPWALLTPKIRLSSLPRRIWSFYITQGAGIKHLRFALPPAVINFHPLSRDNVSTTRQPQPGCLHFHHVTTWLSSIFGSKRDQTAFRAGRTKSSRTKDTIKD